MTSYITLETALRMLSNTYLVSVIVLMAGSYLGLVAIETMEKSTDLPKSKWFI